MRQRLRRFIMGRSGPTRLDMARFQPRPEGGVLVGGAVRDALLSRPLHDVDWLVTSPEAAATGLAQELGGVSFALDEERGQWRVLSRKIVIDLLPLRGALEDDLRKRDFTVNALAALADGRIVDVVGGLEDLKRKRLRMTSKVALTADPLRIFRAVRFSLTLGFEMEPDTADAIRECARALEEGRLPMPAWERLREELDALIECERPGDAFAELEKLGLLVAVMPELAAGRGVDQGGLHHLDVLDHSLEALQRLATGFPDADRALRWATLLHDIGKPRTRERGEDGRIRFHGHDRVGADLARSLCRRLRKPTREVDRISGLVRWHMLPLPRDERSARRFAHRRRALLPDLLKLMIADREAARGPLSSEAGRRAYRTALSRIVGILEETPETPPLLDGSQVMQLLDIPPGPRVGQALAFLSEAQAVGDVHDESQARAALLRLAQQRGWLQ